MRSAQSSGSEGIGFSNDRAAAGVEQYKALQAKRALLCETRRKMRTAHSFLLLLALMSVLLGPAACQDSYSCAGSSRCKNLPQSDCDAARRQIQPGNRYFTGGNKGSTGVCSGHCGLFVSGSNCDLTGTEMITAFNELRDRKCAKCGIKTYNDGCKFKADYVTGC